MMRWLTLLILLSFKLSFAQEPAHFIIGSEELAGVHIYDLKQDSQETFWLATNSGLIKYDGYSFKHISNPEMTSNSLFNLCIDQFDQVYCNNLSGQIFRITDDSCELFFQIPDSLMNREITLNIDEEGDLIVVSNRLFYINQNRAAEIIESGFDHGLMGGLLHNPFRTPFEDKKDHPQYGFYVFDYSDKRMYRLNKKKLTYVVTLDEAVKPNIFDYQNDLLIIDRNSEKDVYQKGVLIQQSYGDQRKERKIFQDGHYFWFVQLTGGVKIVNRQTNDSEEAPVVFSNRFISAFFKDKEGNIILGTFGDGLIVIPNMNASSFQLSDQNDRPTKIVNAGEHGLIVGTQKGKLYQLTDRGDLNLYRQVSSKFVESLVYLDHHDKLLVDDNVAHLIDLKNDHTDNYQLGALKFACELDKSTLLVASNQGVSKVDLVSKKVSFNVGLYSRTNSIGYSTISKTIYAGTSSGLLIGEPNNFELFELEGDPILATFIANINDSIFVCTANNGVLIFYDKKHVNSWNISHGFPTNNVHKVIPYNDKFVIKSEIGIFVCSDNGSKIEHIKIPEGMTVKESSDIAIRNDYLYLAHSKGIQRIYLGQFDQQIITPGVIVQNVLVNENHIKDFGNGKELASNQNKIKFELAARTLKYKNELLYKFRLVPIDQEWQYNTFEENLIEYKSLPAGEYLFEYGTVFRGEESDIQALKFSISQVFWKSVWFWVGIIIFIIILSFFIYKSQLRRIQEKSRKERELISSKLTAIQSQMNPHFIFNSLNSIQDLVLNQQGENAYNYISKFAFLVRKVLHYSEVEFIQLEDELQVLMVYLELEELRFDDDFEFHFDLDIDDEVEIPPMIIQPFVENAIKHGLLHKSGNKRLDLRFKLTEHLLLCEIEDNGVGRQQSKEINERKRRAHESFSTSSIRDRFEILKNIHGGELGVNYVDKMTEEGPQGTIVKLQIPVRRSH